MRILVLVQSPVAGDARVEREARTLAAAGHQVTVVGRGVPVGYTLDDVTVLDAGRPAGLGSAASGRRQPGPVRVVRSAARWTLLPTHREKVESAWRTAAADVVRYLPADAVHAHDRNTLSLGAAEAARRGVPLVYDAHELWSDRGLPGRPTPLADRRRTRQETAHARTAAVVLTVSEGIADVLRGRGLRDVRVVRNTFPAAPAGTPADRPATPVPSAPTGLLYAGRIGANRDLETLVAAADHLDGLTVTLVGPQDPHVAAALRLPAGVEQHPAQPVDDLDDWYRARGIAAITLTAGPRNHRLALPNKVFHAVRAGVPVVAADLPELRRLVRAHDLGELYTPGDPASLAAATARVRDRYADLTAAVRAARDELSWERDARVLLDVYAELAR